MFSERYLFSQHWNQLRDLSHAPKYVELSQQNPITGYVSGPFPCVALWKQMSFIQLNSNRRSNANVPKTTKKMQAFKQLNDTAAQTKKSMHRYTPLPHCPSHPKPLDQQIGNYTGRFITNTGITKIYYRKTVGHVFTKPVQIEGTQTSPPVSCFSS